MTSFILTLLLGLLCCIIVKAVSDDDDQLRRSGEAAGTKEPKLPPGKTNNIKFTMYPS